MTTKEEVIAEECRQILHDLDYLSGIALPVRVLRRIESISQKVANIQNTLGEGDPK